jgi:hypothetical protein
MLMEGSGAVSGFIARCRTNLWDSHSHGDAARDDCDVLIHVGVTGSWMDHHKIQERLWISQLPTWSVSLIIFSSLAISSPFRFVSAFSMKFPFGISFLSIPDASDALSRIHCECIDIRADYRVCEAVYMRIHHGDADVGRRR